MISGAEHRQNVKCTTVIFKIKQIKLCQSVAWLKALEESNCTLFQPLVSFHKVLCPLEPIFENHQWCHAGQIMIFFLIDFLFPPCCSQLHFTTSRLSSHLIDPAQSGERENSLKRDPRLIYIQSTRQQVIVVGRASRVDKDVTSFQMTLRPPCNHELEGFAMLRTTALINALSVASQLCI